MSDKPIIDWEPLRQYGPSTITCRCGRVYRSLFKSVIHQGRYVLCTETPCPQCDLEFGHVIRAATDPETMVINEKKP